MRNATFGDDRFFANIVLNTEVCLNTDNIHYLMRKPNKCDPKSGQKLTIFEMFKVGSHMRDPTRAPFLKSNKTGTKGFATHFCI